MLDFKKEKQALYAAMKTHLDPLLSSKGFVWNKDNFWTRDRAWCVATLSLGARKRSNGLFCEVLGGVSVFLPEYHQLLGIETETVIAACPTTFGGPIHWIDERLDFDSGRFTTWPEFERWLPHYRRAFEECAIPELDRYPTEEALLDALLADDWLKAVKLTASQDRRGGLVALMMAKRDGKEKAIAWARADIERIRAQEPGQERPGRWQDLRRAVDYLSAS